MRKLGVLGVIALLVMGLAPPVIADHAVPVEGEWRTKDKFDKSRMFLTVEEVDDVGGIIEIVYVDTLATVGCVPPAEMTLTDRGELYDDGAGNPEGLQLLHLEISISDLQPGESVACAPGSVVNPGFPDPLIITWELVNPVKLDDGTQKWKPAR